MFIIFDLKKQLESGILVCPQTRQKLIWEEEKGYLRTIDGNYKYRIIDGKVPLFLVDEQKIKEYLKSSGMVQEYKQIENNVIKKLTLLKKIENKISDIKANDYRTELSINSFENIFENLNESAIALSIGGGPRRHHPKLINLNIDLFMNVDVVADAHCLPYSDESIDAIFCEAVLEHLYDPDKAVSEMFRVMKKGSKAFICTPFLQSYHGYPHHYQNFTLTGHKYIFEKNGFNIIEYGTCVGPTFTLVTLVSLYIRLYYYNRFYMKGLWHLWEFFGHFVLKKLDKKLNLRENSHIMASTTYLLVRKD